MTVADRWLYFPLIGLLACLGLIAQSLKTIQLRRMLPIVFVILTLLSVRTIVRTADWRSELALYSHDTPIEDNYDNEYNLGVAYSKQGFYNQALHHVQKSVKLFPYERNILGLALIHSHLGTKEVAYQLFKDAYQARSFVPYPYRHDSLTYYYLGKALYLNNKAAEAIQIISEGLKDYPNNVDLLTIFALSEYKQLNVETALSAANKAYEILPTNQTLYLLNQIKQNREIIIKTD